MTWWRNQISGREQNLSEVIRWREHVLAINDNAKSSKQYRDNTLVK
jgi:hypothetical protein